MWVIGGAGYLGRPVVELLAAQGARVLCIDLEGRAAAAGFGPEVETASLDLNDTAATEAFVQEREVPDGVAVLTFASTGKRLDEHTPEEFDRINHGNLTATFVLARAVADRMAARGSGSIVLFSSMYGTVAPDPGMYVAPMNPNAIAYGVGKAGLQQMVRYLAVHYGPRGVRCNGVSPGPFPRTSIQDEQPDFITRLAAKVPLGRVGQAAEMAAPVAFLLSEGASFITGHNLAVDGGWTAW